MVLVILSTRFRGLRCKTLKPQNLPGGGGVALSFVICDLWKDEIWQEDDLAFHVKVDIVDGVASYEWKSLDAWVWGLSFHKSQITKLKESPLGEVIRF